MKPRHLVVPTVAGLVVVLTYFLVQGVTIDAPRHERADALQEIILRDATLQRDMLRARAGLLPSYDPLVESIEGLQAAVADLPAVSEIATGRTRTEVARRINELTQAVHDQETLVEAFKSDNALLRNSLSYFNHLSGQLTSDQSAAGPEAEAGIGTLATAMLHFINTPGRDTADEVNRSLDSLDRLGGGSPIAQDLRSLASHARLILDTLPRVDAWT